LSRYTSNETLIASAILHDVVEDGNVAMEDLKNDFGEEVAGIVSALTEDETIKDWSERKGENLARLSNFKAAYVIKAVDALVNMQDLFTAIENDGESVWKKFNAPKEMKMQYFEKILEDLKTEMPGELLKEYVSALKDLEYSHLIANNKSDFGFHELCIRRWFVYSQTSLHFSFGDPPLYWRFFGARLVRRLPIIVGLVGVVAVVASIAGIAVEEAEDYGEDIEHPLSAFFCHSRPRCL